MIFLQNNESKEVIDLLHFINDEETVNLYKRMPYENLIRIIKEKVSVLREYNRFREDKYIQFEYPRLFSEITIKRLAIKEDIQRFLNIRRDARKRMKRNKYSTVLQVLPGGRLRGSI